MYNFNLKIDRLNHHELNYIQVDKIPYHTLPSYIDLRSKMPIIYDQGKLGSCTANALCAIMQYEDNVQGSRLFLYYNERKLENDIPDDMGATLSDGIKCLLKYGICPESLWPYNIDNFTIEPPSQCYDVAKLHKALIVKNIPNDMSSMKICLMNGLPFVVGIIIYDSFMSDQVSSTGYVPMPKYNENILGGHAVCCVGYDDNNRVWIMRNSYGINWGDNGYFYLPYEYLLNSSLASDLWYISKAT